VRAGVEAGTPDRVAMRQAVDAFLRAAGLDPESHRDLAQTAELVTRAWADEFLDGYRTRPAEVLAERIPVAQARHDELVVLANITFQSVCPHHLLPYGGVAHVAYVPGRHVVGFGQIVRLLDCLGHRLVLQEDLARQVADAMHADLGARGAAVLLEAEQTCLTLRGGRRAGAKATAEAYAGSMGSDPDLRQRFYAAIRGGR
jgi:GTP cyclohydrolase I